MIVGSKAVLPNYTTEGTIEAWRHLSVGIRWFSSQLSGAIYCPLSKIELVGHYKIWLSNMLCCFTTILIFYFGYRDNYQIVMPAFSILFFIYSEQQIIWRHGKLNFFCNNTEYTLLFSFKINNIILL